MKDIKKITVLCFVLVLAFAACRPGDEKNQADDIKLVKGLYSYGPEIRSYTDCEEGREYWVVDSANTLELAYNNLEFEKPYYPVYIEVEGRVIKSDSLALAANFDSTLVVTKVIKLTKEIPDGPCN